MKKLDEKGNVAIILCFAMVMLLGFTAFALDIGLVYAEKAKLSNALDAAALAAVLELPQSSEKARDCAEEYLEKNNVDASLAVITISNDNKSIKISADKTVKHLFAPIIGIQSSDVEVSSKAVVVPAKTVTSGVRPFAVQMFDFSYGDLVTLKEGAGDGYNGNYGAVALGGRGSSIFKINALEGYDGTISVGDYIYTEPGNMAGAASSIKNYINSEDSSFDNFPRDSIRLWIIPLVDSLDVNGRGQIKVVGFGAFYVEDVNKKSGKIEINGRFIRFVANAAADEALEDTGLYGAKLSR